MPYKSLKDINPALKGIKPKITLAQANSIAKWADAMEKAEDGPESAWAAAITQFKKLYKSEGGKWVKKQQKESAADYKGYTTSTNNVLISVNAIDVGGEAIPVAELVAAYEVHRGVAMEEKQEKGIASTSQEMEENVSGSLEDYASRVRDAFRTAFGRRGSDGYVESPYVRDVFKDDPDLGNSVVVRDNGQMYAVDYTEEEDGFTFSDRGKWQEVMLTYKKVGEAATSEEMAEVELSESAAGHAVGLAEAQESIDAGPRAPLMLNVALIEPGWGNEKDKHYYPREMLQRDAHVFEGIKMYATDHRPEEKSVRTEVAVVKTCPVAFTDDGAPIALAAIHDGDFAEQTRNRAQLGTLDTLECSILAMGRTKKGEVDGKEANIVEAITKGQSVDWVTKAGAGGHALNLAENDGGNIMSEQEKQEQEKVEETSEAQTEEVALAEKQEQAQEQEEPQKLAEADVAKLLSETNLPSASKKRLAEGEYEDESALREAILAEVEYVKTLTGSGQPFAQGGQAQQKETKPLEDRLAEIDRRYGIQTQGQEG